MKQHKIKLKVVRGGAEDRDFDFKNKKHHNKSTANYRPVYTLC